MIEHFKVLQLLLSIGQIKTKSLECKLQKSYDKNNQPAQSLNINLGLCAVCLWFKIIALDSKLNFPFPLLFLSLRFKIKARQILPQSSPKPVKVYCSTESKQAKNF